MLSVFKIEQIFLLVYSFVMVVPQIVVEADNVVFADNIIIKWWINFNFNSPVFLQDIWFAIGFIPTKLRLRKSLPLNSITMPWCSIQGRYLQHDGVGAGSFRVELACWMSLCPCGFSLDSLFSYHSPNTCTLIGNYKCSLCALGCLSVHGPVING